MSEAYERQVPDFDTYRARRLEAGIPPQALDAEPDERSQVDTRHD
jgi:hypothetical protein